MTHDAIELEQASTCALIALRVRHNPAAILNLVADVVELLLGEVGLVEALVAVVAFHLLRQVDVPESIMRQFTVARVSCALLTAQGHASFGPVRGRSHSYSFEACWM
jgi:hypothetical protein